MEIWSVPIKSSKLRVAVGLFVKTHAILNVKNFTSKGLENLKIR